MKKLLAFILSVVMVCSIATTAFATEITDESDIKTASGEIVYNLETGYCIEIPEQINALTGSYTFSAYYVNLSDDEQVVVRISGVDEVSHLVLTNDIGDSLTFNVMYDGAVIAPNYIVAVFTDSITANGTLEIIPELGLGAHRAGQYIGTFEFSVSVEARA